MRVHYLDNGDGARVLTAKCYGRRLVSDGVVSGGSFAVGPEAKPKMSLYIIYIYKDICLGIYRYYKYIYIP